MVSPWCLGSGDEDGVSVSTVAGLHCSDSCWCSVVTVGCVAESIECEPDSVAPSPWCVGCTVSCEVSSAGARSSLVDSLLWIADMYTSRSCCKSESNGIYGR